MLGGTFLGALGVILMSRAFLVSGWAMVASGMECLIFLSSFQKMG
jgi:hypothetical protein